LGRATLIDREDQPAAIQLFQRAILLDPNFAMAYASLGLAYAEYSEEESVSNFRKAYALRGHVSDRERFYIEAHYHESVTGDWEEAQQVYELWSQLYPRDDIPHLNVSVIYSNLGKYEDARKEAAESLRLLSRRLPEFRDRGRRASSSGPTGRSPRADEERRRAKGRLLSPA
jgi:tetratricopeptide (TPR) repeat protein